MTSGTTRSDAVLQPKLGIASGQMPGLNRTPLVSNLVEASNLDDLAGVEGLMPKLVRRRSAPSGHQVITEEVDSEMYDKTDGDILNMKELSFRLKTEKDENMGDPWARLGELATFAMCGFSQFPASLAVGVYSKEGKSTLQRQGLTGRDRLWGRGVRVPLGTRMVHAAATLQWGALPAEGILDETLMWWI